MTGNFRHHVPPVVCAFLVALLAACPPLPGQGEKGDPCDEHGDCDDDLVCLDDECAKPYARSWQLTIKSARISQHDPDGETWDSGGTGMPDPFVRVEVDGAMLLQTVIREDNHNATWSESVRFVLDRGTQVEISVWDEDTILLQSFPTLITTTGASLIREEELRQGSVTAFALTGKPDAGTPNEETTTVTYAWSLE